MQNGIGSNSNATETFYQYRIDGIMVDIDSTVNCMRSLSGSVNFYRTYAVCIRYRGNTTKPLFFKQS